MTKTLLIDASHHEEMRVALVNGERLEDFTVETEDKVQNKGNIYVATISRVEPSLQAAFITYGGERNGFLAFGEVHPEFFDVPAKEKKDLLKELSAVAERRKNRHKQNDDDDESVAEDIDDEDARALALANSMETPDDAGAAGAKKKGGLFKRLTSAVSAVTADSTPETEAAFDIPKVPIHRRYKIEEVLKEGQKVLVQVVKEERGSKGAALTTYFALPGRYTVLMPNTPHAGGISRKISEYEDRQALKEVYNQLSVPDDMGLIIRTAGVGQEAKAIQKDFKNLTTLWKGILKDFKKNDDITCVHEDGSIVIRTLRDMMQEDIDSLVISGKGTYKHAKDYMKNLMPDVAKITKEHKEDTPIFVHYGVEQKLSRLHHTRVNLPSGGYLIINPTEALVAVDVNSGRNTSQKNIEETAFKTNMEAAEEVARQMRLRDLAGLIVVDFIDMEDYRHNRSVERAMRKSIRRDRARTQIGNISNFGLMEISRQRLRPSFGESHFTECATCGGTGLVHTVSAAALMLLRRLEEADARDADRVILHTSTEAVVYILNNKRGLIQEMEAKYKYQILLRPDESLPAPDHKLEMVTVKADGSEKTTSTQVTFKEDTDEPAARPRRSRGGRNNDKKNEAKADSKSNDKPTRSRGGRGRGRKNDTADNQTDNAKPADTEVKADAQSDSAKNGRGERGGSGAGRRGRRPARVISDAAEVSSNEAPAAEAADKPKAKAADAKTASETPAKPKKAAAKPKDKPVKAIKVAVDNTAVKPKKAPARKKMVVERTVTNDAPSAPVVVQSVD